MLFKGWKKAFRNFISSSFHEISSSSGKERVLLVIAKSFVAWLVPFFILVMFFLPRVYYKDYEWLIPLSLISLYPVMLYWIAIQLMTEHYCWRLRRDFGIKVPGNERERKRFKCYASWGMKVKKLKESLTGERLLTLLHLLKRVGFIDQVHI